MIRLSGSLSEELQANVLASLSMNRVDSEDPLAEQLFIRAYNRAEQEARLALQPYGYYSPTISLNRRREGNTWQVELAIDQGPPTRINEISLTMQGQGVQDAGIQEIFGQFPLHKGDILDHRLYEQGKGTLLIAAMAAGYAKAFWQVHRVEVTRSASRADILLTLDSGPLHRFGTITYKADFIDKDLLSRMASSATGDTFSAAALTRMRQSLYGSGYFDEVEVIADTAHAKDGVVPVTVTLTPAPKNKYGFGVGYGTDTGVRGTLEWSNRRLNRQGHQIDLQWQPSERKSYFGGVYTIPVRNPRKERLSLLAKYEDESYVDTETRSWTGSVGYDHLWESGEFSAYLMYLNEDFSIGLDSGQATILAPGIQTTWRWADNRITTGRGLSLTLAATGSKEGMLSDATFAQATLHAKAIYTLFDDWRIIGRGDLGGTITDNFHDLPPSLRFYAGGDQSVRGYGYKSIGVEDAEGNNLGGRNLIVYSLELERRLFGNWSCAAFYDTGGAFDAFTDLTLKRGAGAGIRWNAPFGQVRLDLARALDDGDNWRIHFTLGADL